MKKKLTVENILNISSKSFRLGAKFREAFGSPELSGVWIIWGNSGSGKSTFALKLAKEMATKHKVLYNSMEEEFRKSFRTKLELLKMEAVADNFHVVAESLTELDHRLSRRRSAQVVIIDSFQYTGLSYKEYQEFVARHRDKTIIFTSHEDGKYPEGRVAKKVMYDAYMKIRCEGYIATCKGREIGPNGGAYVIWKEGAEKYHGENQNLKPV